MMIISNLPAVLKFIFIVVPFMLPMIWIMGAFLFYFKHERKRLELTEFSDQPYTILIPCYNEEKTAEATIRSLDHLPTNKCEIIAINDGSRDKTQMVLEKLAMSRPHMRVINLVQNRGKAAALTLGAMASRHEFILCIDADSELDGNAPRIMMEHFADPHVAGVTGNPRVKNRGTLVGRLQVGEFSALVGMIKRYHQTLGRLFALSGVLVMFRKSAIESIGYWDTDTVTEDVGISWKLQTSGWALKYEPKATCDVLMPDTLKGLWKQRLRWAQGGFEVVLKHGKSVLNGRDVGLRLILLEYIFSVSWAFLLPVTIGCAIFGTNLHDINLNYAILLTGVMSFTQFLVGLFLHGRYERSSGLGFVAIWYPFAYWMINSFVLFVAIPKVLFGPKRQFSSWISPDRGGVTYAKNN
ncbi:poly-beta-1,6-N-acetyl-D-glucosamine synthase [Bdellovibrio sp. SKB1291214]|uniref:poly-beta-1,6-N-acetyl-D-glucosamine synthase n=1 Tax=Bdellovibrio sp. SKB1291214 TaxID=1732569 RepID=UPI000B5170FC|nr:poly-beta-1,6-N-acetyl-D-glucosamine synthase [Bdellovibrio sp. SKB1291214]UYL08036.1 poly-beta-1,6-N-acetyl-D-glucosamine synthase [Bdellovibrio sp. SKB1291214]